MRKLLLLALIMPASLWANCDLATYRWQCELTPELHYDNDRYKVFCDGSPVYLNRAQYQIMKRYQHSYMNMILTVDGEFYTAPCRIADQ